MRLSVIIPVYNECSTITEVLERVAAVELEGIEKEIIVSDDGSTDGSADLIERERVAYADLIRVYTSPVNLGKGAAIRCGLRYATGEIVLIQDADLELDPNEYHRLLQPIMMGKAAVVYGVRFHRHARGIPLKTTLVNKFLTTLTNLLFRGNLNDMETAYKVFRADVIRSIRLERVGFDFEPEVTAKLLKSGCKIHEVPISYNPRTPKEGKKIHWKDGVEAIWTLLKYRVFE